MRMKAYSIILTFLAILFGVIEGQVTSIVSTKNFKILPDSYTQLHLVSQEIYSQTQIDSTDVSVKFNLKSDNDLLFNIIIITNSSDYDCYQKLISPKAPYQTKYVQDQQWILNFSQSQLCGQFAQLMNTSQLSTFKSSPLNDLFNSGKDLTNYSVIIDNTQIVNDLKGIETKVSMLHLSSNVTVMYKVSDKWFIYTVIFGSLDLAIVLILFTLMYLYRKKIKDYKSFLKHKQRKLKGDYKKYDMDGGEEPLNFDEASDAGGLPQTLLTPKISLREDGSARPTSNNNANDSVLYNVEEVDSIRESMKENFKQSGKYNQLIGIDFDAQIKDGSRDDRLQTSLGLKHITSQNASMNLEESSLLNDQLSGKNLQSLYRNQQQNSGHETQKIEYKGPKARSKLFK